MSDAAPFNPLAPTTPFSLPLGDAAFRGLEILRHLEGKRLVCAGQWQGRDVVAKIYFDPQRHAIHAKREAVGAAALQTRGILTAALLHRFRGPEFEALVFERIVPAQSALSQWNHAKDDEKRHLVLLALVRTLAALHNAGLVQEDAHLDNFLFAQDRVYTLDGAAVRIRQSGVDTAESLKNLATLFAQLPPDQDALSTALYPDYAQSRGWTRSDGDIERLRAAIERRRTWRRENYLRKIFRSSSAFETQRESKLNWVCDREYASPALRRLLADPDAAFNQARLLKEGNTSTVGVIDVDGRALLIKRYNLKNLSHALGRALRETRAAVSWRNAHRLRFYGLPTPRPVALVEKRWGPFKRVSYFISDYIDAENCERFFKRNDVAAEFKDAAVERVGKLFDALAALRIEHGDTKASNFLWTAEQASMIDLDAMRQYRRANRAKRAHARDVERFLRNWQDLPALYTQFERRLRG